MSLLIDKLKLKAAAGSMHQFLPVVRAMYPRIPPDEATEAATVFLYAGLAREVFGRRFAHHLRMELRPRYKFAMAVEVDLRILRIENRLEALKREAEKSIAGTSSHAQSTAHVTSVIRALLGEACPESDDHEHVRAIFPRFEDVVRRIKNHLLGIKRQARFVMKS
jgi:hypothetical protein